MSQQAKKEEDVEVRGEKSKHLTNSKIENDYYEMIISIEDPLERMTRIKTMFEVVAGVTSAEEKVVKAKADRFSLMRNRIKYLF